MRLTYKAQDQHGKETGTIWYASTEGNSIFPKSDKEEQALKKLAAYEDTGLSPEEFRERTESVLELYGKLKPYVDAEEQGLLVRLPCKVGDTLYAPTRNIVSEFRIIQFEIGGYDKHYLWVNWYLKKGITGNFRIDVIPAEEIGKTVFLTREEAEAALKGGKHDAQ